MAIGIIVASQCKYKAMQWLVMTTAGDDGTCSACYLILTRQFDSNLGELKSTFNEINKIR